MMLESQPDRLNEKQIVTEKDRILSFLYVKHETVQNMIQARFNKVSRKEKKSDRLSTEMWISPILLLLSCLFCVTYRLELIIKRNHFCINKHNRYVYIYILLTTSTLTLLRYS
jgi:hypothetical protein